MMTQTLVALALLVGSAAVAEAQTSHTGFLVDLHCWGRPGHIALDGAPLESKPDMHSVHCMADIKACRDGGFAVLEQLSNGLYNVKYTLDAAGNTNALAYLDALNTAEGGMRNNVLVTVSGTLSSDSLTLQGASIVTAPGAAAKPMMKETSLDSGLTLETMYDPASDVLTATIMSDRNAWVGFGVPIDGVNSMTSDGKGTDMIVCTQTGGVKRHWVTGELPSAFSGGVPVPGATCTFADGKVSMTFSRAVAATGDQQRPITPGKMQDIFWAYGVAGDLDLAKQHDKKGISRLDLGTTGGLVINVEAKIQWSLWLHLLFMSFAFGWFLPFGAAIAKYTKKGVSGAKDGAWFKMHRIVQMLGLCSCLLGFLFILIHNADGHVYDEPHAIMGIICISIVVLQPFNALVRPSAPDNTQFRTTGRLVWEVVHKTLGWGAILLGIPTMVMGALLVTGEGFEKVGLGVGLGIGMAGALSFFCYTAIATVKPDNPISQSIVGGGERGLSQA